MNESKLTVLIPAFNEESNIGDCLESVSWADEILVADSYSTDKTIPILKEKKINFIQREYQYSASQKNWALDFVKTEWVLIVDADERITPELKKEILDRIHGNYEEVGYYIARKNFFLGKWIRHNDWYPDYNLRLFKVDSGRYEDKKVHAHVILQGQSGKLNNPMEHFTYTSVNSYLKKFSTYTTWDANERYKIFNHSEKKNLNNFDSKMKLKYLWHYIPLKPLVRFIWMYVVKRGFLDGKHGFYLAILSSFYDFVVNIKLNGIRRGEYN